MKNIIVPVVGLIICLTLLIIAIPKVMAYNDDVIGYTEHGHAVYADDIESDTKIRIPIKYIETYDTTDSYNSIIVKTKDLNSERKSYKLLLSGCWDIDWTFKIGFQGFSSFYVEVGDKIVYQAIGETQMGRINCTIVGIVEYIDNEK